MPTLAKTVETLPHLHSRPWTLDPRPGIGVARQQRKAAQVVVEVMSIAWCERWVVSEMAAASTHEEK
jgi:hypothetical protein